MSRFCIQLPPKFAASCLMGLLYNLDQTYNLTNYGDRVEISGPDPHLALQDVLTTARQKIEDRSRSLNSVPPRIPASGNDRRVLRELWQAYGLGANATIIDFINVVNENIDSETVGQHLLPSILKPEFYEFNRLPGYMGESSRLMRNRFPALSISLSLIGYIICRVGSAQLDRDFWVSVVLTPELQSFREPYAIDPSYRLSTFINPMRRLDDYLSKRRYNLAGLFPETALHLWLATHMGGAKINLYALKEPKGQNPATIYSSMKIDLEPIHRSLMQYGLQEQRDTLIKILENALRAGEKSAAKHISIRFSILLYEVLTGMKPFEEFVYTATREYLSWNQSQPSKDDHAFKSYQVSRWAAYLARHLARIVSGGTFTV